MKRRNASILIVLLIMVFAVTSCGKTSQQTAGQTKPQGAEDPVPAAVQPGQMSEKDKAKILEAIDREKAPLKPGEYKAVMVDGQGYIAQQLDQSFDSYEKLREAYRDLAVAEKIGEYRLQRAKLSFRPIGAEKAGTLEQGKVYTMELALNNLETAECIYQGGEKEGNAQLIFTLNFIDVRADGKKAAEKEFALGQQYPIGNEVLPASYNMEAYGIYRNPSDSKIMYLIGAIRENNTSMVIRIGRGRLTETSENGQKTEKLEPDWFGDSKEKIAEFMKAVQVDEFLKVLLTSVDGAGGK